MSRRRSLGAEVVDHGVDFRVWAPAHETVSVVVDGRDHPLRAEPGGYFSGLVADLGAGAHYRFRLDDERDTYPDPASRFQPHGPHEASEVIDPTYAWRDRDWRGIDSKGVVIYELHVGTFTRSGTWAAAIEHLDELAHLGINLLEVMPIHEFPGEFGWGYDGVDLWAPTCLYGRPDDFRRFVDAAHARGIAVILDVVYNHFGPDGCYLRHFTPDYFTKKYENDWGESVNFDGRNAAGVRELVAENAAYWIDEFHLDGLRLDATQSINDETRPHVMREIRDRAYAAARGRSILIVAENEPQDVDLLDVHGIDAMWNDDWHHAAMVALTGRAEAYYTDYEGRPQEFVSMAKHGFLYQGQRYKWQKNPRGTPSLHVPAEKLICFVQNHDQVANSATGERIHRLTSPGRLRAMTALLLLQPQTPMLFQGQEFAASAPFLYFADHEPELAAKVHEGRREFMSQFASVDTTHLPLPHDRRSFERCRLDHSERARNAHIVALHRDLIRLRRSDRAFALQDARVLDGAILNDECFLLRWLLGGKDDRLLIVNLGRALHLDPAPEPLLAPLRGRRWETLWSSEAPEYGGFGTAEVEGDENWRIPAQAAVVLRPV